MLENSVKCALWLKRQILGKNITISISTSQQMLSYIPLLAGLYVGAIINPWDPKYFEDDVRVMYFLVEYKPEVIFVDRNDYLILMRAINRLNLTCDTIAVPKIVTFGKVEGHEEISLESILSATSYPGKTYIRYFSFVFPSNQEVPEMSPDGIGLWYGPLSWTYHLLLTIRSIVSYVTVIKCSKFYDENMYNAIEKYKVKWVFLQSAMCSQLFKTDIRMYDVSSLKQLIFGDSAINHVIYEQLIKHFTNASIVQVYSLSKVGIIAAYQRNSKSIGSSGHVAKNVNLMILNEERTKANLSSDTLGEIWFKLTCKWCNTKTCKLPNCIQRKKNKNKNITLSSAAITSTWHCTEDYGFYKKTGEIFIIDKIKNLIKYKLYCIPPTIIENVLQNHPAVLEVVVKSVPHREYGEIPMAYIRLKYEYQVTKDELIKYVQRNVTDVFKHGDLCFTKEMPYLPNGKIDRSLVGYIKKESYKY
ncbi:4-coumarate--CoA ligase-like 9 isoform X2 [Monomorium pharaonis]|uniref:4-coumarate--CoA ligase-like 9 isoform X2 n=1 Tax=Monomorium pharaonis TaxID=307658 RepID=UPI0017465B58|nr:4-coumarate--CoA ligase-like 9 isoform X2 [Monomorium pharaonis]